MILDLFFSVFSGKHHENCPDVYGFSSNCYLDVFYLVIFVYRLGSNGIHRHSHPTFGIIFMGSPLFFIEESKIQVIVKSFSLSLGNFWGKMIPNLPTCNKKLCHGQV